MPFRSLLEAARRRLQRPGRASRGDEASPVPGPRETLFASVVVGSAGEAPFGEALERRDWSRLSGMVGFDPRADVWVLRYAPRSASTAAGSLRLYFSPFALGADDACERVIELSVAETDHVEGLLARRP